MAVTVEELQILLSCDATQAKSVLDTMTGQVDRAVSAMSKKLNGSSWSTEVERMTKSASEIMNRGATKMPTIDTDKLISGTPYERLREQLTLAQAKVESIKSELAGMGDADVSSPAVQKLYTDLIRASDKAEKLAMAMAKIEDSAGQGDGASAGVSESGEAAAEATPKIEEYNRALAETGNASNNVGKKLPEVSKNITKHANAFQKLGQMFKRVLLYRAIRSLIQSITKAIQEGYKNAYEYSKQSSGEASRFAKALDSVKSASLTMKNQLGAAFSSLAASIAPAVTAVINLVTRLAKAITQLFALMGGSSTYMSAVEGLDATGEAASGAGGKVKGLLADFDELNIIGQQGGGGGGGSGLNASQMFEEIPVDSKLKEMFDLSGVPESIERLLEAWDRLKKVFENTNFSWAINTFLLDPLRTVIDTATDIITIISSILNGDAFGTMLGIGSLIFNSLVNTVVIPFTRLIDAIFGTNLTGKVLDFKNKVNEGTSLLFNEGVRAELFRRIREPFEKAWEKVKEVWDAVATWFDENVVQPIVDFFAPIVSWLSTFFKGAWQIIRAVWVVAADWFNDSVWTPIKDFFTEAWDAVKDLFISLWDKIKAPALTALLWIIDNIAEPISMAFARAFDAIRTALRVVWWGIKSALATAVNWIITNIINKIIDKMNLFGPAAAKILGETWTPIEQIGTIAVESFDTVMEKSTEAADSVSTMFDGARDKISDALDEVNDFSDGLNKIPKNLSTKWTLNADVVATGSGGASAQVNHPNFNINMAMASGGIAYGETLARIGEYAGARSNPEVVAPLNKLQGILEKTSLNSGGKKETEKQNALLAEQNRLLRIIAEKELKLSPSPELGQVMSRSAALYGAV